MVERPTYEELENRVRRSEIEIAQLKRREEELLENKRELSQILQEISIPTFVIDGNHILTYANKAFECLTGISADKIIGTREQWQAFYSTERPTMADLIVDNTPEKKISEYYSGNCRKSDLSEGGYEAEAEFRAFPNESKWLFFTASPLRNREGNVTGAVETLQNITKRKQTEDALRESERRLGTLLDFVPYPMVVFTLDGRVYYLNPSFTETFGWTLDELEGKTIPYTPLEVEEETGEMIKRLLTEKTILRHVTKRLTKDGRVLDVVMRAGVYSENKDEPAGELVILRDITREMETTRSNEAILRISTALPEYPDLEELLHYISSEIKRLLHSEGALVILLDEEEKELFFMGAAYDDSSTQERIKEIRFPVDQLVAGKVIHTGEPLIVSDTSEDPVLHRERDKKLGYHTKNLLLVPLKSSDRIIGTLCAINKKEGAFNQASVELLGMIAGTVAISIENARFSEELRKAYMEVASMNRARDKVINHLSHELKTPVSVLSGSLNILTKKLQALPDEGWKNTVSRSNRNLERIVEIQNQVEDIMQDKHYVAHGILSVILDQCSDELETLLAEELGEGDHIQAVRRRIDELFGPKEVEPIEVVLDEYVKERLDFLKPLFLHRQVEIFSSLDPTPPICIPLEPLRKVIDGLIKNAVENTPDEGRIEVITRRKDQGAELVVLDSGVGIIEDAKRRIFEGFFSTQDTMAYSSKRAFDFNAGGKGADLLRMKIFSERYSFKIDMESKRCIFIPKETDSCPGIISKCNFCNSQEECHGSGGTKFILYFPPASKL